MSLAESIQPVIIDLKRNLNARAVVLLDPKYKTGDASGIAGIKTPEVTISFNELTEYINQFAAFAKTFLKNIHIDDETAPRTMYISTEDKRVFLFRFFVKSKGDHEPFPVYLGLTVKKDLEAIKGGAENPWEIPQFVFDAAWDSIKEIQRIYKKV